MGKLWVLDVAMDAREAGNEAIYTYAAQPSDQVGEFVLIQLGARPLLGLIIAVRHVSEEELGFPASKLRSPTAKVRGIKVPAQVLDLARYLADQYLCPLPVALGPAWPPMTKQRLRPSWALTGAEVGSEELTAVQKEALQTLRDAGGSLTLAKTELSGGLERALKSLRKLGLVEQTISFKEDAKKAKAQVAFRLTSDEDAVKEFFASDAKRRPAQALVLLTLGELESRALTSQEIRAMTGVTETTLKSLVESKLLVPGDEGKSKQGKTPTLTPHQQLAVDAINEEVQGHRATPFLLFGVTGSGKTEVFLRAATQALSGGRQVLHLVPEIALATQAVARLRERFGDSVAIVHSELTPTERFATYQQIQNGEVGVVLGARSALFAPLNNVGLIVVDEEHESSYKQESAPRYHAKRLALKLAELHNCPVVFASATPSVESYFEAENEQLRLLSLPKRAVAKAQLPAVHIEDLVEGFRTKRPALLSPVLVDALQQTLDRKEQAILFLNRRAFAPAMVCRECGEILRCPNCSVSLSFHRKINRVKCHHCGYISGAPTACPGCKSEKLKPLGVGTEQVQESVAELFPEDRVDRMDRDVTQKKGALESVLAAFGSGETDILVGTQMVAKGLDFPNVTLVGVIAADQSLAFPDFRASERTYQLLNQVAGRAGRSNKLGQVIFQTFSPGHPAITCAAAHDYTQFYDLLKTERQEADYPPFCRLVNIVMSCEDKGRLQEATADLKTRLTKALGESVQIQGPADCLLEKLNTRWRRHMVLKFPPNANLRELGKALDGPEYRGVQMTVDVDPYNLS